MVKPNAKVAAYEILDDGTLKLSIRERPIQNMANKAVIKKIAEIYGKPKGKIKIKSGLKSKNKIVTIDE